MRGQPDGWSDKGCRTRRGSDRFIWCGRHIRSNVASRTRHCPLAFACPTVAFGGKVREGPIYHPSDSTKNRDSDRFK